MALNRLVVRVLIIALVDAVAIEHDKVGSVKVGEDIKSDLLPEANAGESDSPNNAFIGVYSECFLHLSYTCLQKKTLQYLKELDKLSEISVIGDYVKFVKLNATEVRKRNDIEDSKVKSSEELSHMIDKAVDHFFSNHFIRLSALGKDILVPHSVEEFVGRKRRKGGGGGGHGGGDGDGGKKKMMMMAMMCMKMKLMMMVPAMMGMMGMMSFKGMMFSMMSFMISKMMLLMKILEKKGGGGGGGGGGGDGGWAAGGGGGGAWMPAGGADYGGGGGYDANAQWSSRSILEKVVEDKFKTNEKPIITYVKPIIRYNNNINDKKPLMITKNLNDEIIKANNLFEGEAKSRRKRGIMDVLQNAYMYWANKVLGFNNYKFKHPNFPKYKIINGVKYVYYPIRQIQKAKAPKEYPIHNIKIADDDKPVVIAEDFNKGEIVEGVAESRMSRKKLHKMTDNMNETMDENPWQ